MNLNKNFIHIAVFVGILIATVIIAYLVNRFFMRLIRHSSEEMKNDPTNYQFLHHVISAVVYIVGFSTAVYSMPSLRALASSLLAGAGILAVAIGFASQQAMSNIISGLFMVIFKPFRVNDRLQIRELTGIVEDITLRHTIIRNFENKRILIPNSLISDEIIINSDFVDDKICKWIDVRISYQSNIDKAREIIQSETIKHPLQIDPRSLEQIKNGDPQIPVRVVLLGEYAVHLRAWVWAKDSTDGFVLSCDLLEIIKKRFGEEGIEIPFPYQNILLNKNITSN